MRWYGLALTIAVVVAVVVVVAVGTQYRSEDATRAVSYVGDHSNVVSMGYLQLTEWKVAGLGSVLENEMKAGDSVLEVHNIGQTAHRLVFWRGGEVQGDQVVGGTLVAETSYIRPGELATLHIDLEPGAYVLICSVRGHAARGMYATVQLQ